MLIIVKSNWKMHERWHDRKLKEINSCKIKIQMIEKKMADEKLRYDDQKLRLRKMIIHQKKMYN